MLRLHDLRAKLGRQSCAETLGVLDVLSPFFLVVRSEETDAVATGTALQSLNRFLAVPYIVNSEERARLALGEIIVAATHCQFDVADANRDEAVLIKILHVLAACVKCKAGWLLDGAQTVQVIEACVRIGYETRHTDAVRCVTEETLLEITQTVFQRVADGAVHGVQMEGVLALLCALYDPEKRGCNLVSRLLGLSLLNCALETLGPRLCVLDRLVAVVCNDAARAVLRNATTNNILVLSQTLRLVSHLIALAAPLLHGQIELFCSAIYMRIEDTSPELLECILDALLELLGEPATVLYLYRHYDCAPDSPAVLAALKQALRKIVQKIDALNNNHIQAMRCHLALVHGLLDMDCEPQDDPSACGDLREMCARKKMVAQAVCDFNTRYQLGLDTLRRLSLVAADEEGEARDVAAFLHTHGRSLDKKQIGLVLRLDGAFHARVLQAYMAGIDMHGQTIDEALRHVVHRFEFTGEGQQVERLLMQFGKSYCDCNPQHGYLKDADSAWMFATAIVLLNTDLHTASNSSRMSLARWAELVAYIGVPAPELERIYDSIFKTQLRAAAASPHKSDLAWNELVRRSNAYPGSAAEHVPQISVAVALFKSTWPDVVFAVAAVLDKTLDTNTIETGFNGLLSCALFAAQHGVSDVFDALVAELCRFIPCDPGARHSLVEFACNAKTQMACKTLFSITRNHGDRLRAGWRRVLALILHMHQLDLLPDALFGNKERPASKPAYRDTQLPPDSSYLFGLFVLDNSEHRAVLDNARKTVGQCKITELLSGCRLLADDSLTHLVDALLKTICQQEARFASRMAASEPFVFCMQLLNHIVLCNKNTAPSRVSGLWLRVSDFMIRSMASLLDAQKPHTHTTHYHLTDILLAALLTQATGLAVECVEMLDPVVSVLWKAADLLDVYSAHSFRTGFCRALETIIRQCSATPSHETWRLAIHLLERHGKPREKTAPYAAAAALAAAIGERNALLPLPMVAAYASSIVSLFARDPVSVHLLEQMHVRLNTGLAREDTADERAAAWEAVLNALAMLCTSHNRRVRNDASGVLQRVLLGSCKTSEEPHLPPRFLDLCLDSVLFPLVDSVLAPDKAEGTDTRRRIFDPRTHSASDIEDIQMRIYSMATKVFLHHLPHLLETKALIPAWQHILDSSLDFMVRSRENTSSETIAELVKNMLLVMKTSHALRTETDAWHTVKHKFVLAFPTLANRVDLTMHPSPRAEDGPSKAPLPHTETQQGETAQINVDPLGVETEQHNTHPETQVHSPEAPGISNDPAANEPCLSSVQGIRQETMSSQ